ncbi:natterin-4-like [Glossina fuscipes]|uniref:Natterin-4-like n=1 Tax=Glossina fuscipes TaxID=7396 RepID=A0A9C6DXU5_9MUSC|nr:natterin-4-like [Glossina fuscipes]XP_037895907.1 natterin-4-like [Glossina fuscipes]KAI9577671.1 hypothetical protein GQX74_013365 [Glossina fuscipes]
MSTLNVLCAICSEYFRKNDNIYATTVCGHVFHHQCLYRWLAISNTCPQCRSSCHRRRVHRIFLNFSEPSEIDELPVELRKEPEWIYYDASIKSEDLLAGALKVDTDEDGNDMYIARVYLHDDLLPAYYVPQKGGAYTAWNCRSHFLTNEIEILDTSNDDAEYKWITQSTGEVPPYALITGYCETGENLYTARAEHEGHVRYGKLHPSHGVAYMPYKELEVNSENYEVLARIPASSKTEDSSSNEPQSANA